MSFEIKSTRPTRVVVIGGGYVGLPLAVEAAEVDMRVTIVDTSRAKVRSINRCESPTVDITDKRLHYAIDGLGLKATTDYTPVEKADVIVVCVPTPLRKAKDPDVSYIRSAFKSIAPHVQPGQLFILESTTYPGFTREVVVPAVQAMLLAKQENALTSMPEVGRDYFVAFSPERVDPGNQRFSIDNTPKVVGGITTQCLALAEAFYKRFIDDVHAVSSTDAAETVKLLENTFRAVNIGLANELSFMCRKLGVDTREVIDAAATKPFGYMPFYPGPGVGGHCIKPDPHYLSWRLRGVGYRARFIDLADAINEAMPQEVVNLVAKALNRQRKPLYGSQVHILGVTYKPNVSDTRESPALTVMSLLAREGANLTYEDPHVPELAIVPRDGAPTYHPVAEYPGAASTLSYGVRKPGSVDVLIVLADHDEFSDSRLLRVAPAIVDARGLFKDVPSDVAYYSL